MSISPPSRQLHVADRLFDSHLSEESHAHAPSEWRSPGEWRAPTSGSLSPNRGAIAGVENPTMGAAQARLELFQGMY